MVGRRVCIGQYPAHKAGETVDFMGVKAIWAASMSPEQMRGAVKAPYEGVEIHRQSKDLFKKGSTGFLMRTPEGAAPTA